MFKIPSRFYLCPVIAALAAATPGFGQTIQVPSQASLQTAIDTVADGGVIEIAGGTYPATSGGFLIANPAKNFTIRAAGGATVVLDGGGTSKVLWYTAGSAATRGSVVFEGLTVRNGFTTTTGQAGGVTLTNADATFFDCTFENNTHDSSSGHGGGVGVYDGSTAIFIDSLWQGNVARGASAGLRAGGGSTVWVHRSRFLDNRTNLPDHRASATGGAVGVVNAKLWVTNTRFEDNQAGFAGGAIYALAEYQDPDTVPRTDVTIANSTFVNNHAVPDPGISTPSPTEGGAIHSENQTRIRVFNSRLLDNSAQLGGAISSYRAALEVYGSELRGNVAYVADGAGGTGGTIKLHSNDSFNESTDFGAINRPSASLIIRDSLVQGRFGGAATPGLKGGCISAAGDIRRTFGTNPDIPPMGTPEENRAPVVVTDVVFHDCDVDTDASVSGSGVGGVLQMSHSDLTVDNSLFLDSDATGSNGKGGVMRMVTSSVATITDSTFAKNTAVVWGGALYFEGSEIGIDGCRFIENEVSPGVAETDAESLGAAIYATPAVNLFGDVDIEMTGTVSGSIFSNNVGLDVWDDDRVGGPINDVQYLNNQFFNSTFGGLVYRDKSAPPAVDVAGLNALVVVRNSGVPSTDKSPSNDDLALGSAAVVGHLVTAPPQVLQTAADGDPAPPTDAFAGFAWSGGSASFNGLTVSGNTGLEAVGDGVHTLSVAGQDFLASISQALLPSVNLTANPPAISGGETSDLQWSSNATFLDVIMNRGVAITSSASGSVTVQPPVSTDYTILLMTEEGGAFDTVEVLVDEALGLIFMDGFESGDVSAWASSVP